MNNAPALQRLLEELERLPGIGSKSAQRIAYWMMNTDSSIVLGLADAIADVKKTVHFCSQCFNYAQNDLCDICASPQRDTGVICVVSEPRDIAAIERTGVFSGLYHVLGGEISPMDGIGPDELHITELMRRLGDKEVRELILATNPNIEGETTASYIARMVKPLGISISRLASGMPVGGELDFIDEITLGRAIEQRREI